MNRRKTHQPDSNVSYIWDKVSKSYNWQKYWASLENVANLQVLISHIGELNGKRIIEMGSGSGYTSTALAMKGASCALLDISSDSLEVSKQSFVENGLAAPDCYLQDALSSGLPSETFDVAWNGGVIEHFLDSGKEQLLREMHRIVKPGGLVIVLVPNSWCIQFQAVQVWMKKRGTWPYGFEDDMSPLRLWRMATKLGFADVDVYAFNSVLGWRWIPRFGVRITSLLRMETLALHTARTPFGFVSVMAIRK
jgi:ubiquinone/menaquinone biosynthesis C-methylase UbiE